MYRRSRGIDYLRAVDVEQIKKRLSWIWGQGDYSVLSHLLEPAAGALCDACAVSAGQEVLDVAAGDGNFALAAAREGAKVVASDLSPGMVERGRQRTAEQGYDAVWVEADAEDLPFEAGRFDCVASVFGAMIAPRPRVVAEELFRVARPGGVIGMTAWRPGSFAAEMIAIGRRFVPPDPDYPLSEDWGREDVARERFEGLASSLDLERRTLTWDGESPEAMARQLAASAPTLVAAREVLSDEQLGELRQDLVDIAERHGSAADGSLLIETEYLQIVAHKPG
jgi:SAM-dependent methyltransferase